MAAELAIGKQALRSSIKKILKTLSNEYIVKCSQQCALRVRELPAFHRGGVVCTYVSMPTEIQTDGLIGASFDLKKRVCIPKVLGKESSDMIMIELPSVADLLALPKNSWGIPEHSLQMIRDNDIVDFTQSGLIDFIVIPGVAFDEKGNRLGHGRGYYDCFLDRVKTACRLKGVDAPFVVAVALDEQIVSEVPTSDHDQVVDALVTPTRTLIFARGGGRTLSQTTSFCSSGFDHVCVVAQNVPDSIAWYGAVLGLKLIHSDKPNFWPRCPDSPAFLTNDAGTVRVAVLPLSTETNTAPGSTSGNPSVLHMMSKFKERGHFGEHFALRVSLAEFTRARKELAPLLAQYPGADSSVEEADYGLQRSLFFSDLDGNVVELTTWEMDSGC